MNACPFCSPSAEHILLENDLAYALADAYPVTPGHTLVIPRQHEADYFTLPAAVKAALWQLVDDVQALLAERYQPAGFNLGVNVGATAGQTVPHVHVHVIPRYPGDTPNPRGGVRHVIPEKGDYLGARREAGQP